MWTHHLHISFFAFSVSCCTFLGPGIQPPGQRLAATETETTSSMMSSEIESSIYESEDLQSQGKFLVHKVGSGGEGAGWEFAHPFFIEIWLKRLLQKGWKIMDDESKVWGKNAHFRK